MVTELSAAPRCSYLMVGVIRGVKLGMLTDAILKMLCSSVILAYSKSIVLGNLKWFLNQSDDIRYNSS